MKGGRLLGKKSNADGKQSLASPEAVDKIAIAEKKQLECFTQKAMSRKSMLIGIEAIITKADLVDTKDAKKTNRWLYNLSRVKYPFLNL